MFEPRIGRPVKLHHMLAQRAGAADIAEYLGSLSGLRRVHEALGLRGKEVGQLYEAMAGGQPLALEELVPADAPAAATFIFEGRNSAPAFSRFQKRFARLPEGRLIGHNEQTFSLATGPGYFVVQPPSPAEPVPDEPFFDYTVSPGREPTGWPRYQPNRRGLSLLVFANMKDFVRRVAEGVCVGKAFKKGEFAGFYFVLARAD